MRYILLMLLLIQLVYAQEQNLILSKDAYQINEMFQAEIFKENIKPSDISVLNPVGYRSNIGINLLKITNNHYFVYFKVPEVKQGVYTLQVKEEKKQFQITSQKAKLSISTGAVKFTRESSPFFKITVSNNGIKSQTIDILSSNLYLIPSLNQLIIPAKSSKTFNLKLQKPSSNILAVLSINNYNIPVWYIIDEERISFFEEEVKQIEITKAGLTFYTKLDTQLNYITKEIQESIPVVDSIYFENNLNESIKNIKLSLTGNLEDIVKLDFTELEILEINEKKKLDIIVNENRLLLEDEYSGDLIISSDKHNFKLPMNFIVVEAAEEPESITIEDIAEPIEEEPEANETITEEPEEEPSKAKYIYLIVLIIILIILAYLFFKKPKLKKQTFKEFIKKSGY